MSEIRCKIKNLLAEIDVVKVESEGKAEGFLKALSQCFEVALNCDWDLRVTLASSAFIKIYEFSRKILRHIKMTSTSL